MKLGEIIKSYRTKNKITMQEFADSAGLSKGYISMLEKNQHPQSHRELVPSFETYLKVAEAMRISIDELIAALDDNESVRLNNSSSTVPLAPQEEEIIDIFRALNDEGQHRLIEYGDDLVSSGKYIKSGSDRLVEEA